MLNAVMLSVVEPHRNTLFAELKIILLIYYILYNNNSPCDTNEKGFIASADCVKLERNLKGFLCFNLEITVRASLSTYPGANPIKLFLCVIDDNIGVTSGKV
jgi:hypothetical protein